MTDKLIKELHPSQKEVAVDTHPYRVVCCGRQWGKTTLAVMDMIAFAYYHPGCRIAYFATTFNQARDIAWAYLKNFSKAAWAKEPNESRLELLLNTKDGGTAEISLRGFENIETVRGQQFDFVVIDEVASLNNWKYNWEAILEPTLIFRHGIALFVSTPKGFNHFYDMYNQGQTENKMWKSWHFTSYDNPWLDKKFIDEKEKTNSEEYFAQEYLADFRKFTGLVHKPWDRRIHLIEPFDIPPHWQYGRGFDFGSRDGTASVRAVFDDDWDVFIERSYLDNRRTTKEHAEAIRSQDYDMPYIQSYGDPSGAQWMADFEYFNINIEKASKDIPEKKGYVEYGVEKINERLLPQLGRTLYLPDKRRIDNAPHLFVFNTPDNLPLVKQIEALKWRESVTGGDILNVLDDRGDPTGYHYDLLAALRYLLVSWSPESRLPARMNDFTDWRI